MIAAAIALLVLRDTQVVDAEKSLSFCTHVAKVKTILSLLLLISFLDQNLLAWVLLVLQFEDYHQMFNAFESHLRGDV